jgi:hypothetical protein
MAEDLTDRRLAVCAIEGAEEETQPVDGIQQTGHQ